MNEQRPGLSTATLLRIAYNALSRDIFDSVASSGFSDLRPSHGNVLEQLGFGDGLRLSEIAARAGMTAQSMGELVDDLERRGYAVRRPDPDDRRAKLIYLTKKGQGTIDASRKAIAESEKRLEAALGRAAFARLRRTVARIIEGQPGS